MIKINSIFKYIFNLKNLPVILTFFVLFLGIFIRTKLLLLNPSFWFDTYALAVNLDSSYIDLFKPLSCLQVAPPLFLVISKFLYNLFYAGGSIELKDFIIRLVPYFCGVLSLPLFSLLLHKAFQNSIFTLWGTFMLSFNICAINYTIEYKQYSCEMLCSIILLLLFYSINIKNISTKKLICYSFAFTIIPWFSNSAWIILSTGFIYLIIEFFTTKQKDIRPLLIIFLPFIINLYIFYSYFYLPITEQTYNFMENYWNEKLPSFFSIENFSIMFPNKVNELIPLFSRKLFWLFLSTNILFLFFNKNKWETKFFTLFPIVISILASFSHMYPFHDRLILFLLPCFIMLYIQCLSILKNKKILNYLIVFFIFLFSINKPLIPIEKYIKYKSITRELFYILKEKNPKLENIIADNSIYIWQSNGKKYLYDNMFIPFKDSKIPTYFETSNTNKYWIYVPYANKNYMNDLVIFLNNNNKIKELKFYYPPEKNWQPVGAEKHAFIAEVELYKKSSK